MLSAVLGGRVLEEKLNAHESCLGEIYDAGRRYTNTVCVCLYIHILHSYSYLIVVVKICSEKKPECSKSIYTKTGQHPIDCPNYKRHGAGHNRAYLQSQHFGDRGMSIAASIRAMQTT